MLQNEKIISIEPSFDFLDLIIVLINSHVGNDYFMYFFFIFVNDRGDRNRVIPPERYPCAPLNESRNCISSISCNPRRRVASLITVNYNCYCDYLL